MTPAATSPPPARTGVIPALVKASRRAMTTSFCISESILEEAPAIGWKLPGLYLSRRQTDPSRQNRNGNWYLVG